MEEVINILWSGPFNLSEISRFNYHELPNLFTSPAYRKTLVYIGKAREQIFPTQIAQEKRAAGAENDPSTIEVHPRRLIGLMPNLETWRFQIDRAEKLRIHSHALAYNTRCIQNHRPVTAITKCLGFGLRR
jgi:hypothetical protein